MGGSETLASREGVLSTNQREALAGPIGALANQREVPTSSTRRWPIRGRYLPALPGAGQSEASLLCQAPVVVGVGPWVSLPSCWCRTLTSAGEMPFSDPGEGVSAASGFCFWPCA